VSLINDALKKAARQRAEDQTEVAPPAQAGRRRRIPRHGAPMSVQTLVLLAGAAVTLIVASVVVTGILVTGKLEPRPAAAAKPAAPTPAPEEQPAVVVQVPRAQEAPVPKPILAPPTAEPVARALPPPPARSAPAAATRRAPADAARPAPADRASPAPAEAVSPPPADGARPAPAGAARPAAAPQLSRGEQAQNFVDRLRVTGARAAGQDSKALVDGHVYRVNDVLDRALGIRLVQVDADHLTLVDSDGATYVKNF
jgi:outer membrane biosynthesis protein TonB